MATKKVRDLTPGTRFLYPESRKTAVLVSLHESGARVKFDGSDRRVEFGVELTGDVVQFERPGRPVLVSDYSDVEVIE
jgi:hypothetical protein